MTHSLELLLDPDADAKVRAEWAQLAEAGLPSQAHHKGDTNAPHISIAVASSMPSSVDNAVGEVIAPTGGDTTPSAPLLPIPLQLGALMVFGGKKRILVRLVVPTRALLELHRAVTSQVRMVTPVVDYLMPDAWTPHVTLARSMTNADLGSAFQVLGNVADIPATGLALRHWDSGSKRAWLVPPPPTA